MKTRLDLHDELCSILGSTNAYYQPPESLRMVYPCIVYSRNSDFSATADNRLYLHEHSYQVTYVTYDPDSDIPDEILKHFPKCRSASPYVSDNLYHYPFDLYY